jgi:hypothetical protein
VEYDLGESRSILIVKLRSVKEGNIRETSTAFDLRWGSRVEAHWTGCPLGRRNSGLVEYLLVETAQRVQRAVPHDVVNIISVIIAPILQCKRRCYGNVESGEIARSLVGSLVWLPPSIELQLKVFLPMDWNPNSPIVEISVRIPGDIYHRSRINVETRSLIVVIC